MRENLFVLGATGQVGKELLRQISENDVPELQKHENPTVVVGLADSAHSLIVPGGLSQRFLMDFVKRRQKIGEITGALSHGREGMIAVSEQLAKLGFQNDLAYADVTGAKEASRDLHLKIIGGTESKIATANKNAVGLYGYDVYQQLTKDPTRYQYSATAMAGLGAVPWLSERDTINDKVHEIQASLSGTVGFITDALTRGEKLSDAIASARKKGYTEPDYRDDLNGVDVARKLTILAREAGYPVEFTDIAIEKFLPDEYFDIKDPEECLDAIRERLDEAIKAKYAHAAERNMTFKYLASFALGDGKPVLKVGLQEVPLQSAFGKLSGTDNRIEVVTDMYTSKKPYRLEGPGAGLGITASVVRRDLVNLQKRIKRF